jgi:signal transduction histidine kinase
VSLRTLTIAFLLAFLSATALTGLASYDKTRATIVELVDERIDDVSDALTGGVIPADRAQVIRRIGEFVRSRDTGDLGFMLTDRDGRLIAGNVRLSHAVPRGYSMLDRTARIAGLSEGRALSRAIGGGMVLTVIAETEPIDNYNAARRKIYLVGFGSIILVVLGGTALFGVIIGRRMRQLRHTVDAIIHGDLHRRVPRGRSGDEFDRLADAFNDMLDRITDLMAAMRNVSNDVAHDLRAPLARLHAHLARVARDPAGATADLDAALALNEDISAMFAAVLRIAEVEAGERMAAFERLDLGQLVQDVGAMMQPLVEDSGHYLTIEAPAGVTIAGDRQLLHQALINLIENAQHYTPGGSRIALAVVRDGDAARLTVSDDGPGIAPDQRATALRRFGRLDASRTRPGHGLGLPLVGAVVRLHHGTLALGDGAPGLIVTIALPL